jgi:hypothetical protein
MLKDIKILSIMYSPFSNATKINHLSRRINHGDSRECFCSTAEAEGLLIKNTYPFSLGSGSVTEEPFGLPIFFRSRVLGIALSCVSSDINPRVDFELQHISVSGIITKIESFSMGDGKFVSNHIQSAIYPAGQIAIKIKDTDDLEDEFAKYRISIFLQSADPIS